MKTLRLATIGVPSLMAKLIASISEDFEIEVVDDIDFSQTPNLGYDAYMVEISLFVSNLDFFLPKRNRTIIWCPYSKPANLKDEDINLLFLNDDEERIANILEQLAHESSIGLYDRGELSAREIDVLRELSSGKTNKEIADTLCISVNTVITHRKNISAKLGIRSASGLSLYALMNGLL
jgi:DNA-binding CsgD family transcriptional regulator